MKRLLFIIPLVAIIIIGSACGQAATPIPEPTATAVNPPTSTLLPTGTNIPRTDTLQPTATLLPTQTSTPNYSPTPIMPPTATPKTSPSVWKSISTNAVSAMRGMQVVYDSDRKVIVLFGGTDTTNKYLADTWEFNGKSWKKISTLHSPSPRIWFGMAYDTARKVTVLMGGRVNDSGTVVNDTWEYDGKDWTQVRITGVFANRGDGPGFVFDSCRNKIILFGGKTDLGPTDTLEFDGVSWTKVETDYEPPERKLTAMVFDPYRCRAVLFGGGGKDGILNDTWEYDGSQWEEIKPYNFPNRRWGHAMAFNPVTGHIILFGGYNTSSELMGDTWMYDGNSWHEITTAKSPPAREQHAMTFDGINGQVMMIGGYGVGGSWRFIEGYQPPTPTPTSPTTVSSNCASGYTRLKVGDFAQPAGEITLGNNIRSEPKIDANIISAFIPGMFVKLIDGPVCTDGFVFWKVESRFITGGEGWTAEGDGIRYFLEPLK
jgi:hypothetical protein